MRVDIDLTQFSNDMRRFTPAYTKAVALGMRDNTRSSRDAVRTRTSQVFDLQSDYILKGIRNTPERSNQVAAATNAFQRYGDVQGRVYLRPGTGKRSLEFMVVHETGGQKKIDGQAGAIPARDLLSKAYRTARGAVRKRWKPEKLLEAYNANGGRNGPRLGFVKKKPFIKSSPAGHLQIVRRKYKRQDDLEVLYTFKRQVRISRKWGFELTAKRRFQSVYRGAFNNRINRALRNL